MYIYNGCGLLNWVHGQNLSDVLFSVSLKQLNSTCGVSPFKYSSSRCADQEWKVLMATATELKKSCHLKSLTAAATVFWEKTNSAVTSQTATCRQNARKHYVFKAFCSKMEMWPMKSLDDTHTHCCSNYMHCMCFSWAQPPNSYQSRAAQHGRRSDRWGEAVQA